MSAAYYLLPSSPEIVTESEHHTLSVEAVALYLINAIYYEGDLEFAQSGLLTDVSVPESRRTSRNSRRRLETAWKAVDAWRTALKIQGLESLRKAEDHPLSRSSLRFR